MGSEPRCVEITSASNVAQRHPREGVDPAVAGLCSSDRRVRSEVLVYERMWETAQYIIGMERAPSVPIKDCHGATRRGWSVNTSVTNDPAAFAEGAPSLGGGDVPRR